MKLTLPVKPLADSLAKLKPITKASASLPILGNVALIGDKKTLRLIGMDLEKRMEISLLCKHKEAGSITLNCAFLHTILSTSSEPECTIETKEHSATIRIGRHTGTRPGLPLGEMPPWPEPKESGHRFTIPATLWNESLAKCFVQSYEGDGERAFLKSIILVSREGQLNIQATNGQRLIICSTPVPFECGDEQFLIPKDSVSSLVSLSADDDIEVSIADGILTAKTDTARVSTKLIESKFHDLMKAVPKDRQEMFTCSAETLLMEIRRAENYASEASPGIVVECKGDEIRIAASDKQTGDGGSTLDAKKGTDGKFRVKPEYLADAVKAIGDDEVTVCKHEENGQAILVVSNESVLCSICAMIG